MHKPSDQTRSARRSCTKVWRAFYARAPVHSPSMSSVRSSVCQGNGADKVACPRICGLYVCHTRPPRVRAARDKLVCRRRCAEGPTVLCFEVTRRIAPTRRHPSPHGMGSHIRPPQGDRLIVGHRPVANSTQSAGSSSPRLCHRSAPATLGCEARAPARATACIRQSVAKPMHFDAILTALDAIDGSQTAT